MSPTKTLEAVESGSYLGLFNITNNGDPSNHIAAIEFDTAIYKAMGDINDNHVGIDINSLRSFNASPAGYYIDEDGGFRNETLMSGRRFQAWVEYDGKQKRLSVTMAPLRTPKPKRPLLSSRIDLSSVIKDPVYVGFSASTATLKSFHYIAGWSFKMNGEARPLDTSTLPKIPDFNKKSNLGVIIGVSSAAAGSVLLLIICLIVYMKQIKRRRRSKFEEVASGLFYLHEKWAQAILHRDIKPGNVLLDENLNGKLGDFGLSKLYEHGSDPHTTRVVGTVGYMASELSRTGKATKASDVYAFGVVMLEVVCGRRPMDFLAPPNMIIAAGSGDGAQAWVALHA
ncbi:hypothetical protein H6P81_007498 [Aristolochia fimbriata]|uniref:Protein kinase domain-containing protein n=1 Tax=Aristolochia fimbriata TaxID=158543 RepID=A0AAV7F1K6_ARIFI|nr:hypothetical protein H6P81_007498 [Aristolochia fimbriata]